MMAETARLVPENGAAEQNMGSPDPREHKRIDQGVHNVKCAMLDRFR